MKRIISLFFRSQSTKETVAAPEVVKGSAESTSGDLLNPSLVPYFIRAVANHRRSDDNVSDEARVTVHQNRDPRRALASLREGSAGPGSGRSEGTWSSADTGESILSRLRIFPEIEVQVFVEGTVYLEHRNGAEHNVFFDPETGRVIKLTQPGEFGASGGLKEYVQRMVWANEFFEDEVLIEGWLKYPNEESPRLITSQPWYRVSAERPEPTMAEIAAYMWRKGFLKAYDGVWIHADREVVVSDALPKNYVLAAGGYVHAIDVILVTPGGPQWERLQNMVMNQPQMLI